MHFLLPMGIFFQHPNFARMLECIHLTEICYILKCYCNWQFKLCPLSFAFYFLLKCLLPCSDNLCQWEQNEKKEGWCPYFRNTARRPKIRTDIGVRIIQNGFVSKCKSYLPSWIILAVKCGKVKSSICLGELKGIHKGNHNS